MKKLSAGIVLYEVADAHLRVLLVHPGGPFWAKKDLGAWSIPKGEYEEGGDALATALRELGEETGLTELDASDAIPLGSVRQSGGKSVTAWAVRHDFDVTRLVSNTFELEWPKGTGLREFPEVDRAEWFAPPEARRKLVAAQAAFVDRLVERLRETGHEIDENAESGAEGPAA